MTSGWRVAVFSKRFWLAALAVLALPLLAEFNARLVVTRQLFEEEARLVHEIEVEQARAVFLQSYAQYAQSAAYVEWWARVRARLVKPGEIAVAPQFPATRPDAIAAVAANRLPRDISVEWWAAFFASVP
jgi:cell division protein FtsB